MAAFLCFFNHPLIRSFNSKLQAQSDRKKHITMLRGKTMGFEVRTQTGIQAQSHTICRSWTLTRGLYSPLKGAFEVGVGGKLNRSGFD